MKSYALKILVIALLAILAGCERELDTLGVTTKITFYPVFELEGDEEMVVQAGEPFTIPGATATEQGTEIPVSRSIAGTYFAGTVDDIDTSVPDIYTVSYSAVNVDGFSGTATRTVFVKPHTGDLVNSLEGTYLATSLRTPAAAGDYEDMEYVYVIKIDDNTYQISDAIGGYYDLGRAYGSAYAGRGATVQANNIASNDFTFDTPGEVGVFGGEAVITDMQVNAAEKTITYNAVWDVYTFKIILKQVP